MDFNCQLPLNAVSFGATSISLLREFRKMGLEPCLIPIAQPDLSAEKTDEEFNKWLNNCIGKTFSSLKRKNPSIKLWHINGSLDSYSNKQVLFTFYELDAPTKEEVNILKNQDAVIVSNQYTANVFKDNGVSNVHVVPLGFDAHNFSVKTRKYLGNERIVFNLPGKFEKRKGHQQVLNAWIKKYGSNPKYQLNCAIYNPFLRAQQNGQLIDNNPALINQLMAGRKIFNVKFLGFMGQNEIYNDYLNSGDVVIGVGTEGFNLPSFISTALGKHSVILDCAGHREWANAANSVLISPNGKTEAYDNMFFHKGQPFNQGNIFTFDDDEFIAGCETAIQRVEKNRVNSAGLELQKTFTSERTAKEVLAVVESLA